MIISSVLQKALSLGASDVFLAPNSYPSIKSTGEIVYLEDFGIIEKHDLEKEVFSIIPEKDREVFQKELEIDFSITLEGHSRFRVNAYKQRKGYGVVFRVISSNIPSFEDLGLPESVRSFASRKSGLVLITGGVGSGKSTTLSAIIGEINKKHARHIITIEDPIEFIHESEKSLIQQREVGKSTKSFANALKYALRQSSDVIMIGEMRDLETFRLALRAAETGNLVFATLHTSGAARTVARIIDMFPGDEKDYIKSQVAESLLGVVWQDLVKKEDGSRVIATEVLIKNKAIENMIREGHIHQIDGAIETGKDDGMIPMKRYLENLCESGEITEEIKKLHMKRYGILSD